MKREEYNYWISNINNIGPRKIETLFQVFECAEGVFRATKRELEMIREGNYGIVGTQLGDKDIDAIIKSRDMHKVQGNYAKLEKHGIYFVSKEDERYPSKLKQIYSAPFSLYVKGNLPKEETKSIAIVGARECSAYGIEMAKFFAGAVAKEGIAVISGLARGIDSYAHEGALAAGGVTYAVMGCGIDICYPIENIRLHTEIQEEGGIISEYAPGVQPYASNFPMRNRIISGLCDAILVIEAKQKSGSLITVDMGLEQGRDIYALPGRITDRLSEGCNNLIKMGAKLVTSPKDILEDFFQKYEPAGDEMKKNINLLDTMGKIVYASLSLRPKHLEEISGETKLSMDIIMEQLLLLELRGFARQTMKNYYVAQD